MNERMKKLNRLTVTTEQEAFDTVWGHLHTQIGRSIIPGTASACAYRGADGKKCAAGVLIYDADYSPDFENITIAAILSPGIELSVSLMGRLQDCHDRTSNWSPDGVFIGTGHLVAIAKDYSLDLKGKV